MDFTPNDVQREITDLTAQVLDKERDPGQVELDPHVGFDAPVWAALAKAGLLALALPTRLGGDGLGIAEVSAVLRPVAASGARVPALATLALGVLPLVAMGTDAQQEEFLPSVAAGTSLLTGAPNEFGKALVGTPATTAVHTSDGWELNGRKIAVPYAAQSIRILVPAKTTGGDALFLVDPAGSGVELTATLPRRASPSTR